LQLLEPLSSDQLLLYPSKVSSHFAIIIGKIFNTQLTSDKVREAVLNFVTNKLKASGEP
jgi:hypothetical protein